MMNAPQVRLAQLGIDDVESLLAALEALFDKRQQHPILLVRRVKESADMTLRAQLRAGKSYRRFAWIRSSSANVFHRTLLFSHAIFVNFEIRIRESELANPPKDPPPRCILPFLLTVAMH
jgi:hypothetical protein